LQQPKYSTGKNSDLQPVVDLTGPSKTQSAANQRYIYQNTGNKEILKILATDKLQFT